MADTPRFPRLTVLRFDEPPETTFEVDAILQELDRLSLIDLWWVTLEHSCSFHDMSFEADEGRLTANEDRMFYQATRDDLTFVEIRPAMIHFLLGNSAWQHALNWERTPHEAYNL